MPTFFILEAHAVRAGVLYSGDSTEAGALSAGNPTTLSWLDESARHF
jgi:hypothetical protein